MVVLLPSLFIFLIHIKRSIYLLFGEERKRKKKRDKKSNMHKGNLGTNTQMEFSVALFLAFS
jgi:hypothetical protein